MTMDDGAPPSASPLIPGVTLVPGATPLVPGATPLVTTQATPVVPNNQVVGALAAQGLAAQATQVLAA
jgi:hypothetical protein